MILTNKTKGIIRAALVMREIDRIRYEQFGWSANVLVRAALAVTFMCLIVISYEMGGVIGLVIALILSLVALFVPVLHIMARDSAERRLRSASDRSQLTSSHSTSKTAS